jgi:hypothetical protein
MVRPGDRVGASGWWSSGTKMTFAVQQCREALCGVPRDADGVEGPLCRWRAAIRRSALDDKADAGDRLAAGRPLLATASLPAGLPPGSRGRARCWPCQHPRTDLRANFLSWLTTYPRIEGSGLWLRSPIGVIGNATVDNLGLAGATPRLLLAASEPAPDRSLDVRGTRWPLMNVRCIGCAPILPCSDQSRSLSASSLVSMSASLDRMISRVRSALGWVRS